MMVGPPRTVPVREKSASWQSQWMSMRSGAPLIFGAGAWAACRVDLGQIPDAAVCNPSPDFFVSDVFPRYLVPNQCGNGGCHDFATGHGTLRLRPPFNPPAPGTPLDGW